MAGKYTSPQRCRTHFSGDAKLPRSIGSGRTPRVGQDQNHLKRADSKWLLRPEKDGGIQVPYNFGQADVI